MANGMEILSNECLTEQSLDTYETEIVAFLRSIWGVPRPIEYFHRDDGIFSLHIHQISFASYYLNDRQLTYSNWTPSSKQNKRNVYDPTRNKYEMEIRQD